MSIDPQLESAYREADYCVHIGAQELVLKIGTHDPATDRLLAEHNVAEAAFITASNPGSRKLGRAQNAERHEGLRVMVDTLGLAYLEGEGRDSHGEWGGEASLLVFGINESAARKLAANFGQNVLVYVQVGAAPRLVLTAGLDDGQP